MTQEIIEISKLQKNFGDLLVLDNISFAVKRGEILSIIGPSGAGKSTLLRVIAGLENNYEGHVTISQMPQFAYFNENRIAFVTQAYGNFPWLKVHQNIGLGLTHRVFSKTEREQEIVRLINDLQLNGFKDYFPNQLSGGMQQRVAIGRALAQGTEIMAMDEPFGALDYQTRQNLQLLIKALNSKYHKTILFVTHDIEEAIFVSDRIIVLSKTPSTISEEYIIPIEIKNSIDGNVRYTEDFVDLRKSIENSLKKFALEKNLRP